MCFVCTASVSSAPNPYDGRAVHCRGMLVQADGSRLGLHRIQLFEPLQNDLHAHEGGNIEGYHQLDRPASVFNGSVSSARNMWHHSMRHLGKNQVYPGPR